MLLLLCAYFRNSAFRFPPPVFFLRSAHRPTLFCLYIYICFFRSHCSRKPKFNRKMFYQSRGVWSVFRVINNFKIRENKQQTTTNSNRIVLDIIYILCKFIGVQLRSRHARNSRAIYYIDRSFLFLYIYSAGWYIYVFGRVKAAESGDGNAERVFG